MFGFFSKGEIKITLNQYQFLAGDTIGGTLTVRLKKPLMADSLQVGLLGVQKTYKTKGMRAETIFDFMQPIDGEKEYPADQDLIYTFSLRIPGDILNKSQLPILPEGVNNFVKTAGLFFGGTTIKNVSWYVVGRLSVSGFDISKQVSITVS